MTTSGMDDKQDTTASYEVEFDREGGYAYLRLVPSFCFPCCSPLITSCTKKHIDAQACTITDRHVIVESGWLDHSNKTIPLDSIQSINVREDCLAQYVGVATLEIQTAGVNQVQVYHHGGPHCGQNRPEVRLIAPKNVTLVRDILVDRRDAMLSGRPPKIPCRKPSTHPTLRKRCVAAGESSDAVASTSSFADALDSIKTTLAHIDDQLTSGFQHLKQQ